MAGAALQPKFITFDCYSTLIDWQMSAITSDLLGDRVPADQMQAFLDDFEAYRIDEVLGAYKYYPEVIKNALRRACERWRVEYRAADGEAVAADIANWGPHPDVPEALATLAEHYPLVILSNAADDQIRHNVARLGAPFHAVYTAEQAQESTAVLNKAAGFLRSVLSRDATMRSVPRLTFYFDTSVGQGRHLESLISRAAQADRDLGLRGEDPDGEA